jgi:hypothetical protein
VGDNSGSHALTNPTIIHDLSTNYFYAVSSQMFKPNTRYCDFSDRIFSAGKSRIHPNKKVFTEKKEIKTK